MSITPIKFDLCLWSQMNASSDVASWLLTDADCLNDRVNIQLTGTSRDPTGTIAPKASPRYLPLFARAPSNLASIPDLSLHCSNRRGRSIWKDHKPKPAVTSATALTASFSVPELRSSKSYYDLGFPSLASRSAFKRAVFSRVARASASYSVTAARPSCARCSFLKLLSARCRA